MKLTVEHAALVSVLETVGKFVPRAHIRESFTGVELVAQDDKLFVRGGDEIKGMLTEIPASIAEKGIAIVEHNRLLGLAKNLRAEPIQLTADEKALRIIQGKSKHSFGLFKVDYYMPMPELPAAQPQTIYGLGNALKRCAYTQNRHEDLYQINKIVDAFQNIWVGAGRCIAVAQDQTRVAITKHDATDIEPFLLPAVTIPHIRDCESIDVSESDSWIFLHLPKGLIYARKIDISFPLNNVDKELATEMPYCAEINRVELLSALNRLLQVCGVSHLTFNNGVLRLKSQHQDHKGEEEIAITFEGEEQTYAFTTLLLIEMLRSCVSDAVRFELTGKSPSAIRVCDGENIHVIMSRVLA